MAKGFIRIVSLSCVLAMSLTGCTNGRPEPLACAAIGALAGGAGGAVAYTHANDESDWETAGVGVGSAILLGAAGYFICKALQGEEAVAETPPPAPAPAYAPEPEAVGEKIVLRGVNFDFDKSSIRPDAAVILDEAVVALGSSSAPVMVEGHTDWVGSDAYNQGLSERRAESVRRYLSEHGVDESRLSTAGYGESRPIASNETREGRALNRRVELLVQD
jgi:outer membrane protein OmpA-like peptidoglycan-associated protein